MNPLTIRLGPDRREIMVDIVGQREAIYRLSLSDNLKDWHPLATFQLRDATSDLGDSYGMIAFNTRISTTSQAFYRLSTIDQLNVADVQSVKVTGSPGDYRFSVEVASQDKGCEQYADWWEVLSPEGELLYRRILLHSHTNEQPFTRSGGPVDIQADEVVWVRAHMTPCGYGGTAFTGSPESGFQPAELPAAFAAHLVLQSPQPEDCAF